MKKLLLLLAMCTLNIGAFAQSENLHNLTNPQKDLYNEVNDIDFYGVDYSHARTIGATESTEKFVTAFIEINKLFISESSKYNVYKYFNKNNVTMHIENMCEKQNEITGTISTDNDNYKLDFATIKNMVYGYDVDYQHNIGVVIIAEKLNKTEATATYYVVYFDNMSKDIIAIYPNKEKTKGFGLRNYWARSVYETLHSIKGMVIGL